MKYREIVIILDNQNKYPRLPKISSVLLNMQGLKVIRSTAHGPIEELQKIGKRKAESLRNHFYEDAARSRNEEWQLIYKMVGLSDVLTSYKTTELLDEKYYAFISINSSGMPKTDLE